MNVQKMLEDDEGRERSAYQDTEGWWTIGIGRLIDKRKGGGLSEDEIDYLFANDLKEKTAQVMTALPWVANLNEPRQAVLISMCFQMGIGSVKLGSGLLGFTNTLRHIENGRWAQAAMGMRASRWARQTPKRAMRMAAQMETGVWSSPG